MYIPFTTTSVITQDGQTALMKAASKGHTEVVVELVKAKANLDLQDKVCHYSVYMYVHVYIQEHNIVVLVIVCETMYHTHYTLNMICNHECIHVPFTIYHICHHTVW